LSFRILVFHWYQTDAIYSSMMKEFIVLLDQFRSGINEKVYQMEKTIGMTIEKSVENAFDKIIEKNKKLEFMEEKNEIMQDIEEGNDKQMDDLDERPHTSPNKEQEFMNDDGTVYRLDHNLLAWVPHDDFVPEDDFTIWTLSGRNGVSEWKSQWET